MRGPELAAQPPSLEAQLLPDPVRFVPVFRNQTIAGPFGEEGFDAILSVGPELEARVVVLLKPNMRTHLLSVVLLAHGIVVRRMTHKEPVRVHAARVALAVKHQDRTCIQTQPLGQSDDVIPLDGEHGGPKASRHSVVLRYGDVRVPPHIE